jgi:hypothetical protein
MAMSDIAHVSVVPRAAILGTCELCATEAVERAAVVVVKHTRGGSVSFAACDRCALAVRRLAAAAGGQARFEASAAEPMPPPAAYPTTVVVEEPAPELIEERAERLRDAAGTEYVVRVYGRHRADGLWVGWIEFLGVGSAAGWRTDTETTQPSRSDLAYWASGLEPLYFEGAFQRAHPTVPVA